MVGKVMDPAATHPFVMQKGKGKGTMEVGGGARQRVCALYAHHLCWVSLGVGTVAGRDPTRQRMMPKRVDPRGPLPPPIRPPRPRTGALSGGPRR